MFQTNAANTKCRVLAALPCGCSASSTVCYTFFVFLPRLHPPRNVSLCSYPSHKSYCFSSNINPPGLLPYYSHLRQLLALAQPIEFDRLAHGYAYVNMPRLSSHVVVMPSPFCERFTAFPPINCVAGRWQIHVIS